MNILYVYPDEGNLWERVEWRCKSPARAINHAGRHRAETMTITEFCADSFMSHAICEKSDLFVIFRNLCGKTLNMLEYWKTFGKAIVADMDTPLQFVGRTHPDFQLWNKENQESSKLPKQISSSPAAQFRKGLQWVDALTVPTRRIVDDWKSYTQVYRIPGFIDLENYDSYTRSAHDGIVIGWKGNEFEVQSLKNSGALEAIGEICKLRSNVRFMVCMDTPAHLTISGIENILYRQVESESGWPGPLFDMDIAIAPLEGEMDQRKSWNNILEFMVAKIPWVGSTGAVNHELHSYGWLVKNQAGSWKRVLIDMVDHLADYQFEAAREPYLFSLSQGIDENVQCYIDTYALILRNGIS